LDARFHCLLAGIAVFRILDADTPAPRKEQAGSAILLNQGGVVPLVRYSSNGDLPMSNPTQNKPGGKPGQRSRKPDQQRGSKPAPPQSSQPEPQAQKPAPSLNHQPQQQPSLQPVQQQSPKPVPHHDGNKQIDTAVASANTLAIDFQTLATAYSDYSKKSIEQTRAFVEKLSGVRSLDKAIEIQTEFARQAYETFVTESQRIRELYSGLARQSFKPFERLVARTIPAPR
jgi:chemotaxis protein histidine kinase CheA